MILGRLKVGLHLIYFIALAVILSYVRGLQDLSYRDYKEKAQVTESSLNLNFPLQ